MNAWIWPRLIRPTVARVRATARVTNADGSRAVRSLRTPESLNEAATIQLINGGLFKIRPCRNVGDQVVATYRASEPQAGRDDLLHCATRTTPGWQGKLRPR